MYVLKGKCWQMAVVLKLASKYWLFLFVITEVIGLKPLRKQMRKERGGGKENVDRKEMYTSEQRACINPQKLVVILASIQCLGEP